MIPEEYKNETDYRKIPTEYLDSQIPQGRGMVKWAPFATLPEQFERLQDYILDQDKIQRPVLREDQLHDLNCRLHQALHSGHPIRLEYFSDGWLHNVDLHITRMDMLNMKLEGKGYHSHEKVSFSLLDIIQIELLEP